MEDELWRIGSWPSPGRDAKAFQAGIEEIDASFATSPPSPTHGAQSVSEQQQRSVTNVEDGRAVEPDPPSAATVIDNGDDLNDEWMATLMDDRDQVMTADGPVHQQNPGADSASGAPAESSIQVLAGVEIQHKLADKGIEFEKTQSPRHGGTTQEATQMGQERPNTADSDVAMLDNNDFAGRPEREPTSKTPMQDNSYEPALERLAISELLPSPTDVGPLFAQSATALSPLPDPDNPTVAITTPHLLSSEGKSSLIAEMRDEEDGKHPPPPVSSNAEIEPLAFLPDRAKRVLFPEQDATEVPENDQARRSSIHELLNASTPPMKTLVTHDLERAEPILQHAGKTSVGSEAQQHPAKRKRGRSASVGPPAKRKQQTRNTQAEGIGSTYSATPKARADSEAGYVVIGSETAADGGDLVASSKNLSSLMKTTAISPQVHVVQDQVESSLGGGAEQLSDDIPQGSALLEVEVPLEDHAQGLQPQSSRNGKQSATAKASKRGNADATNAIEEAGPKTKKRRIEVEVSAGIDGLPGDKHSEDSAKHLDVGVSHRQGSAEHDQVEVPDPAAKGETARHTRSAVSQRELQEIVNTDPVGDLDGRGRTRGQKQAAVDANPSGAVKRRRRKE